jgi:predicted DNA-binding antitoxin AbrB/MazE fold protein
MSRNLKAIYENGVLRPLEPIKLKEHQRVTLTLVEGEDSEEKGKLSCYELAARNGLIDAASDEVPTDLSTNKNHFAGFGT